MMADVSSHYRSLSVVNLELKWLEDFIALAGTRSFSQAAEKRLSPSRPSAGAFAAWRTPSA